MKRVVGPFENLRVGLWRVMGWFFSQRLLFKSITGMSQTRELYNLDLGGKHESEVWQNLEFELRFIVKKILQAHGLGDFPDEFCSYEFWATIANGVYDPGTSREIQIWSPVHCFIHRLITYSMNHKKGGHKVLKWDLFYIWYNISPVAFSNIPFAIAEFLANLATSPRERSPICGGHLVPRLACSYRILEPTLTHTLT